VRRQGRSYEEAESILYIMKRDRGITAWRRGSVRQYPVFFFNDKLRGGLSV
jgi:hypothetical protein